MVWITMKTDCFGINPIFEASIVIKLLLSNFVLIPCLDSHDNVGLLSKFVMLLPFEMDDAEADACSRLVIYHPDSHSRTFCPQEPPEGAKE